jgi:hypothetical protein
MSYGDLQFVSETSLRPDYYGLQLKEFGGFYFIAFAGYGISFTLIGSTENKTAIFCCF